MRLPALCRLFAPVSFSFSLIALPGMLSCLVLLLAMLFVAMLAGEGVELRDDGTFSEPTTNMGLGVISNPFFL